MQLSMGAHVFGKRTLVTSLSHFQNIRLTKTVSSSESQCQGVKSDVCAQRTWIFVGGCVRAGHSHWLTTTTAAAAAARAELWSSGAELLSGGAELWSGGAELWSGGAELWSVGAVSCAASAVVQQQTAAEIPIKAWYLKVTSR